MVKATIEDVAVEAGVSVATVDRVLNGRAAVRPPLAQHEGREVVQDSRDSELVDRMDFTEALKELPEAQRETLALAFYGDLTYPEIAERTNTPLGTVKSRALLGMRRLATASAAVDARPNMAQ